MHLNPVMQANLARIAGEQGRNTEALVQEAIARFVDTTSGLSAKWSRVWRPPTEVSS